MSEQPPAGSAPMGETAGAPTGIIRLTIQGNVMTSNAITPSVAVNGYRMPSRYGTQDLVVYAGRNRVDIHAQWVRRYGEASLDVVVQPGQVVDVWYAAPWHQFAHGNVGFEKQQRPGKAVGFAIIAGVMLFAAAVFALSIIAD
jgi:hypothetical protein